MAKNDSGDWEKIPFIICFGEMLIDFVPTISGAALAEAPAFKKAAGGAPANVAVGIARLGGSSAFIGKVGDDEFGHMLSNILKSNNVDNSGVRFDTGARTALAFVTLRTDGEREFMFYRNPSADMLLHESDLDLHLIKKGSIFHYDSISLIKEPYISTPFAALKLAKKEDLILSYDPNMRLPLWFLANREGIKSIWEYADLIKVSEEEISFLTGGEDPYSDAIAARKVFDQMEAKDIISWTSLVGAYTFANRLDDAHRVFISAPSGNVVSWTALTSRSEQNGQEDAAVDLFEQMLEEGFAQNGLAKESPDVFERMVKVGISPSHVTFPCVLLACSHAGLVSDFGLARLVSICIKNTTRSDLEVTCERRPILQEASPDVQEFNGLDIMLPITIPYAPLVQLKDSNAQFPHLDWGKPLHVVILKLAFKVFDPGIWFE